MVRYYSTNGGMLQMECGRSSFYIESKYNNLFEMTLFYLEVSMNGSRLHQLIYSLKISCSTQPGLISVVLILLTDPSVRLVFEQLQNFTTIRCDSLPEQYHPV